jgi:hypothetical protein
VVIQDHLRQCVGFLGFPKGRDYEVAGTCFIVSRPSARPNVAFIYFVTAGHVIDEITAQGADTVSARLNLSDGLYKWFDTKVSQWIRHPDPTVDLALFYDAIGSLHEMDIVPFPIQEATTDRWLDSNAGEIGIGVEVFMLGLFTNHYGKQKNLPIARSGIIAAMPEEKVQALVGNRMEDIDAYLLETRSMGGLSGSPVFAYLGHDRRSRAGLHMGRRVLLLGMMQGHYDDLEDSVADGLDRLPDKRERRRINKGIGIAIPIEKVVELINEVRENEDAADRAAVDAERQSL